MGEKKIPLLFASYKERVKASFYDYIIVWLLMVVGIILQTPLVKERLIGIFVGIIFEILALVIVLYINGIMVSLNFGQSFFKRRYCVKVMKIENKETMKLRELTDNDIKCMIGRALISWFEFFLIFPIFPGILTFIIMNSNNKKQSLADMLTDTVVVKVEERFDTSLKDFRLKGSDPYPEYDETIIFTQESTIEEEEITEEFEIPEKLDKTEKNALLVKIAKNILIVTTSIILICFLGFIIYDILWLTWYIKALTNSNPLVAVNEYSSINAIFNFVSIIAFIPNLIALHILKDTTKLREKKSYTILLILYSIFIITRIVFGYLYIDLYHVLVATLTIGNIIRESINGILVIILLFLLRRIIEESLDQKAIFYSKFFKIMSIINFTLWSISFISLMISVAVISIDGQFNLYGFCMVMYFIYIISSLGLTLTYTTFFLQLLSLRKIDFT